MSEKKTLTDAALVAKIADELQAIYDEFKVLVQAAPWLKDKADLMHRRSQKLRAISGRMG